MKNNFASAVKNAIEFYAQSLGVSVNEAIENYRNHESTRECVALIVLAQANPEKLKQMAPSLS